MVGTISKALLLVAGVLFLGCSSSMDSEVDLLTAFDFESGDQYWTGGVSDYPIEYEDSIYYQIGTEKVNNNFSLDGSSSGLNIGGDNPHGDLFYFFTRKVTGLQSGRKYKLDFQFLVYTQLLDKPDNLSSDELYLKMGAVNFQPELEEVISRDSMEYKILNVEKGKANSDGGRDLLNIGSIKNFTSKVPEIISGNTFDKNFEIESNKNGEIWILIGVDSGIKNYLTFGMEAVTVYYSEL